MKKDHLCPRCQEWTDEKFYCRLCRDLIKRPPWLNLRRKDIYWTEKSHCAGVQS